MARRSSPRLVLLALLLLTGFSVMTTIAEASSNTLPSADSVLVVKSERRLYLMREGRPFRSYKVALGLNPFGHKEREGDYKTPEGSYTLDWRSATSDYFLAISVSYPNEHDREHARRHRWSPGGAIMIHGLPNVLRRTPEYYRITDWTDGCIALNNVVMLVVWLLTHDNTPIEIRP
jgi:murein L,D-transpeptidase YafK